MDAVETLVAHGCDPWAINSFGLSMLHVAAQGDSANCLYYFKKLGLDLNLKDLRGSTPLHWACYSHSEIALSYILAWNPQLDTKDENGFTALHLAVKSVDTVETVRPVRFLMINGADKDQRDNNEQTPLDLVEDGEVSTQNLANELRRMLVSSNFVSDLDAVERSWLLRVPHADSTHEEDKTEPKEYASLPHHDVWILTRLVAVCVPM